ncbi:ABCB8 isoform 2, partial [Pongo abelii]
MLVHLFRVGIRGGPFPGRLLPPLRFQTFSAVRRLLRLQPRVSQKEGTLGVSDHAQSALPTRGRLSWPWRYSDGYRSSSLFWAVAHLRSQLWAHLPRAPLAPRWSPSAWCWVGGALLGPMVLSKHPHLCLVALCEAEEATPASSTPHVV